MTDTNEKIRSLFLTALMVFSVFAGTIAFSGGAAAAANVDIDQATEYSPETSTDANPSDVEIALTGDLGSGNGVGSEEVVLYLDGNKNPGIVESGDVIQNNGENGRVVINLNEDIKPSENLTVKLTDLPTASDSQDGTLVAEDIDVTSQTFTTTSAGEGDLASGETYSGDTNVFRGETIAVEEAGGVTDGNVEVEEDDGGLVASGSFGENSDVYIVETSDLDTGQSYNISVDGNKQNSFTVSDLNMQVNIDDNVGDGANIDNTDTLAVNVSINRGGEEANATLFNEDDEKVAVANLDENVDNPQFKDLKSNSNVVFDFGSVSETDSPYYVEVTDQQTGVSAESDLINVSDSEDGDASFESSTVQDEVGDVANITVQLDNTEDAVINVGSQNDDNYVIQGQLEDDDGDGEVTVQFNSYTAGTSDSVQIDTTDGDGDNPDTTVGGNTVLSVPGDDNIDIVLEKGSFANNRDQLSEDTLEAGSYSINVTAGTTTSNDLDDTENFDADSVGRLRLNDNSVENVQTWAAPSDAEIDNDDVDVYDRIGVNLTQSDDIAAEDVVVHQVRVSGIEGALEYEQEDGTAGDATTAFENIVDTDGDTSDTTGLQSSTDAGLTLYVNRTDVGANADPYAIDFANSGDALTVVDDPDNNTYFVAVDTSDVEFLNTDKTIVSEDDTRINATFAIKESSAISDDGKSASALYSTSERDATLDLDDDDLVTVSAAAGQEVTGTTNVAPGTELEVEMESESDANPFVLRPEVDVATDGTYTATADFSDYSAGTNFTVETLDVDGNADFTDEEDGRIVEAGTATVSISEQESTGSEVVVDSAQLSDGGFIAIHAGNASGDVVGNSEYLEAGSHEDITITLDEPMDEDFTAVAMPHQDTNSNEAYDFPDADGPYTSNGTAVTDSANVTIVEEQTEAPDTETETEAPDTETETEEQTEETTTMDSGTDEVETTEQTGPGFTAALALIALVAAALLAVRRDN
ncbi:DUF7282 domain-containing protein [Haloarcula japonica]|uniref:Cell surface glycoprotein n=1 Tax=Haloarcula japonica (strain ATCC 49778 / DSM 6131 / JCM 7785 / NBRC 101032 / NCIMB 13157 / TR-1) TaxID=1227453 RepID=M0LH84_HALJT|nr:BGTF surface domain-containing protein [Haloarcula japonica]EMA32886.1 hypothetical protein C444_06676 [Haloarcula japonica DSM 6131]